MNVAVSVVGPKACAVRTPPDDGSVVLQALAERQFTKPVLRQALRFRQEAQEELFALARSRRAEFFPSNEVEVRSVVELSNVCEQDCDFCGMGAPGRRRYLIRQEDFLELTGYLYARGRRVVLLQSGENRAQSYVDHVCRCVRSATEKFPDLALILCLGNLSHEQYRQLKDAGTERYILKFETSDPTLYARLKPRDTFRQRIRCLEDLLALGFKVGTGNIVGLPSQTLDQMAEDILFVGRYAVSMTSCSVFIPGEDCRLRKEPMGDCDFALNTVALLRLMYPQHLIPTTSALERAKQHGQYLGLMAGANTVTIHDGTPAEFKKLFPIYSNVRFTPNEEHIGNIVQQSGLSLAKGPLL